MKVAMRRYEREDDFWAIRQFLRDLYLRNGRTEHSWQTARFDYWRWHGIMNMGDGNLETDIFLWETPGGQLGACVGLATSRHRSGWRPRRSRCNQRPGVGVGR
jgi:hypothetical protein